MAVEPEDNIRHNLKMIHHFSDDLKERLANIPHKEILESLHHEVWRRIIRDPDGKEIETKTLTYEEYRAWFATQEPYAGFDYNDTQLDYILYNQLDARQAMRAAAGKTQKDPEDHLATYLSSLNKDPNTGKRENVEFYKVADALMKDYRFAHISQTKPRDLLIEENGVYKEYGVDKIGSQITSYIPELTSRFTSEALNRIIYQTKHRREEFDQDKHILNCKNGFVDLQSGKLTTHADNTEYLSLIQINAEYNPDLGAKPLFLDVLKQSCPDQWEMILECVASGLARGLRVEKILVMVGDANHGKSTVLDVINTLAGEQNISHISLHDIENDKFALSGMVNKLYNIHPDLDDKDISKFSILKMLASHEPVRIQRKGYDAYSARLTALNIFGANALPALPSNGNEILKRLIVALFPNKFAKNEELKERLVTDVELSKILNLLIIYYNGTIKNHNNLVHDQDEETVLDLWTNNADSISRFVESNIKNWKQDGNKTFGDENWIKNPTVNAVAEAYRVFCDDNRLKYIPEARRLNAQLKQIGGNISSINKAKAWRYLALLEEESNSTSSNSIEQGTLD